MKLRDSWIIGQGILICLSLFFLTAARKPHSQFSPARGQGVTQYLKKHLKFGGLGAEPPV